jgi:K+-sensing histidine kinase KdpD
MIGRSSDNDIIFRDNTVSSFHAIIIFADQSYFIEDCDSANGTSVNGVKIHRRRLQDQDSIVIGKTRLRYIDAPVPDSKGEIPIKRADSKRIIQRFSTDTPSPKNIDALKQDHENLKRIYEINGIISSIFDVKELAEKMLDIIFTLFKADRAYIMLLDKESAELKLVAGRKSQGARESAEVDFSRTIAQRVLEQEESIITVNAPEDERFSGRGSILQGHIKSAMCAPIRGRDAKLGIIYVDHRGAPGHFSDDDLQLLTMVANSAGIAIENIRLNEENLKIRVLQAVNEEMRETNRKLVELESLKDDLINMVVHDMKNPVTNTMMAFDLIAYDQKAQLSDEQKDYLQLAKRNQFKLSEMIANLLELSKLESGHMQIERAPVDLAGLINRVVERYAAVLKKEEQEVNLALHTIVGEIVTDERLVERIISNMLSNAIKHSPPKSEIIISVAPSETASEADISIRDFGEGIPREFHQKIFEKFCQAGLRELGHRTDTGLGLAFCKMAVEALGGRIWLESEPKKGSCFTFSLPLQPS